MKYNVIYDKSITVTSLQTSLEATGATINEIFESIGVINLTSADTSFSSVEGIVSFEIEQEMTMTPCDDWHLRRVNTQTLPIRPLYLPKNRGSGSVVYLVDIGIDAAHPELSNSNIVNLWSYNGDFGDYLGHGTSMASLIVGQTVGSAKDATLKVVKIPHGEGVTNTTLLQAFDAILTDHLLTPSTVKVVNCSWVISKSQVLDTKIAELQSNGLVVVAAAGNQAQAADNYSPVGLDTVLGVAASDAYDRVINWATGMGSNWGPEVDITAPGIDVSCAQPDGTIAPASGTSIAAALTSGVVAQYITDNPSLTASQIQTSVIDSTLPDLLFRNEAIYGNTPNRLLQCLFFNDIFLEPNAAPSVASDNIYVQKGTTQTFTIVTAETAPIARLSIDEFDTGRVTRIAPDWVTFDTNTNVITFSPPVETATKKYMVYVEALNEDDAQVGFTRFVVHVYNETPAELTEEDRAEFYTRNITTNTVLLAIGYCNQGSCPPGTCTGQATKSLSFCACSGTFGPCVSF